MLLVDITIVQVALPTMQRSLHASFSDLQWVISAYALSLSALILTQGALADRFGRKRIFMIGLAVFTLASLGLRAVAHPGRAHRGAGRAGGGRCGDVRHLAGAHRPGLPGLGSIGGHRGVGSHRRRGGGHRPARRAVRSRAPSDGSGSST